MSNYHVPCQNTNPFTRARLATNAAAARQALAAAQEAVMVARRNGADDTEAVEAATEAEDELDRVLDDECNRCDGRGLVAVRYECPECEGTGVANAAWRGGSVR